MKERVSAVVSSCDEPTLHETFRGCASARERESRAERAQREASEKKRTKERKNVGKNAALLSCVSAHAGGRKGSPQGTLAAPEGGSVCACVCIMKKGSAGMNDSEKEGKKTRPCEQPRSIIFRNECRH